MVYIWSTWVLLISFSFWIINKLINHQFSTPIIQAQKTFTWESVLENNINQYMEPHLTTSTFSFWIINKLINHQFSTPTIQAQKTFTWESVLENNINQYMEPHLTTSTFSLNWFFDM